MNEISTIRGKTVDFERSYLVQNYLEDIALKYPDNAAVTYQNSTIDYNTLNKKANQIAHFLRLNGHVDFGKLIGVCFTPSIDLIVSILGVIKAGAAYVPIDLNYPKQYIDFILQDANPSIVLTNTNDRISNKNLLNISNVNFDACPSNNLCFPLSAESPAYVIYTSGSTGNPKGVVVSHRALNNHMLWMRKEFSVNSSDKILLKTPLTFDPSIWEVFLPFFSGSELVIAPSNAHIDPHLLSHIICEHQITTIQFVPTTLHRFLKHKKAKNCLSLKRVFVGGESLQANTKKLFFNTLKCQLINLYGPAETTIDITSHFVKNSQSEFDRNCIGKPIYNTELFILNEDMRACPINEPGELYVSGECLSNGYLNNTSLTKNSFLEHPSCPGKKIYKTGDIVRQLNNGTVEYISRKDSQIKINGVRVEVESLTDKIKEYSNIKDCFIFKKQLEEAYAYLVCCISLKKNNVFNINKLKQYLRNFFPETIIPKEFLIVNEFPLLPSGKLNINALKKFSEEEEVSKSSNHQHDIQSNLLAECCRLLNIKSLSIWDDLYNNHMDSLFCLVLMSRIEKKYGIDLSINELISNKTIDSLSILITNKLKNIAPIKKDSNPIIALKNNGHKTPLFLIHPIGGTVFWYNHIVKYFDPERPLYAIQDPGIEAGGHFFVSLEEMANFYFEHIKNIQPNGPYIIGGASFGATVAIEICRNLRKEDVIVIPVLDGWAVYPEDLKDENYFRASMQKQQSDWSLKFGAYEYTEFQKMFDTQKHRLELLYNYHMKKVDHKIALFKSKEILDIFLPIDSYDNNWSAYTNQLLEITNVEGNHETMFQEPNVKKLALKLSAILTSLENISL